MRKGFILFMVVGIFIILKYFSMIPRFSSKKMDFKALVLTGYGSNSYSEINVKRYLAQSKELLSDSVSFLYTCYVKNTKSSNIDCQSDDSPTLVELERALKLAKSHGFKVNLRFYIDILDHTWRCKLDPKNKNKFFDNLKIEYHRLGQIIEKNQVDLFIIGAEYCLLTTQEYQTQWAVLIKELRLVYNGKLSYGANFGLVEGRREFLEIPFWKELDYIGIDHYLPIPSIHAETEKKIFNYQMKFFEQYSQLSKQFGKKIIITEVGFPGAKNGNERPFDWKLEGPSDEGMQARLYKGTLRAITETDAISGVFIWRAEATLSKPSENYKNETGYELYKREAWNEIQIFFNHM